MSEIAPWVQVGGVLFAIASAILLVWWRLQNQITTNQSHAKDDLAAYKLHVAESFVTKQGLNEQTDRLMRAIEGLGVKIDRTNERMDQAFMPAPKPSSRAISR